MSDHEKMQLQAEIAIRRAALDEVQAAYDQAQSEGHRRPEAYSEDESGARWRLLVIPPEFEALSEAQAYLKASRDLREAKAALREIEDAYKQAA